MRRPPVRIPTDRIDSLSNWPSSGLNPLPPSRGRIRTLADVVLQILNIFITIDDEAQEAFVSSCFRENLFWNLDDADVFLGSLCRRFGGSKEQVRLLDVVDGVDFFGVYARTEEEIEDTFLKDA
jgi:hypothetical protein